MRVGFGYDAHPLVAGRLLVLAGVEVPYARGLDGYSDGDVVAHAVIDALLGALALGDCGSHFPAGDARFAGARSLDLLRQAVALIAAENHVIGNVDCTIVAERPALAAYIGQMRSNLSRALDVTTAFVSVKAKRTEGLGFEGESRGIAAYAIASVKPARPAFQASDEE
ncbi:MAG TPA: 2-C-methyl-D-erythritol 2,4-cyclodiphosphate synthase [Candidatus Eremiobacteraceae bacterium]|nr:2-C-methyl-D-erythritol 2,4-cyclodiphosphate synthase [Candidatus Eremiobacteraceae bacterium]